MSIILIGMRWSWKTHIWKLLSKSLNANFIDTDKLIEDKYKKSIKLLVESEGWKEFRQAETSVLNKLIPWKNQVIATWWWMPFFSNNKDQLWKLGKVVWLKISPKLIKERLMQNIEIRPIIHWSNVLDEIDELCNQREKIYKDMSDIIVNIDKTRDENKIVDKIVSFISSV